MPRFEPFHGERYAAELPLDLLVAPPYDVISPIERTVLLARHPANAVVIELPVAPGAEPAADAYVRAARTLADWRSRKVLVRDRHRALYPYRMTVAGHQTTGVIGALQCAPDTGDVLPHEETTPRDMTDRLALLEACRANVSPIWGLSLGSDLGDRFRLESPPAAQATVDGVCHELWVLDDPDQVAAVCEAVDGAGIVLADGHHRFATAQAYAAKQQRGAAPGSSGASWIMAFVVELDPRELQVGPIHRVLSVPGGAGELVAAVSRWFDLEPCARDDETVTAVTPVASTPTRPPAGAADRGLQLVTGSGAWCLHPTSATVAAASPPTPLSSSDVVDSSLVSVALGDLPEVAVRFDHDERRVLDAVRGGEADAALFLRPVPVEVIRRWAAAGHRMPAKSTYFWPKPRTGMVWRDLDG